ncbi:hypothetical protein H8E52_06265 [bacterium]|nr:hypothetical protein [bacterium]
MSAGMRQLVILLILLGAGPSWAGFGMPESNGLWRMPSVRPLPNSQLEMLLMASYYFQDVGRASRFHFFQPRLDLGLGLGGFLELGAGLSGVQRYRSVDTLDGELWLATGGSDRAGSLGAGDLSLKISPPLPWDRLRLAGQLNLRLPMASGYPGPEAGGRDMELRALAEWRLFDGQQFPRTWISLMFGRRLNRGEEGSGYAPSADPDDPWMPFPHFYPAGEGSTLNQPMAGLGLLFQNGDSELFGEWVVEGYHPDLGLDRRENLIQLALGYGTALPRGIRLHLALDMNLSRDDFDTNFEPHFPRVQQSIGISRAMDF